MNRPEPLVWALGPQASRREEGLADAAVAQSLRLENFRACRSIEQACRCYPRRAWPPLLLARLSWKRDLPGALRLIRRALKLEPGQPLAVSFLGELLRKSGRPRQALRWLDRGLAQAPCARAFRWRAQARRALGDLAGARRDFSLAARGPEGLARTLAARGPFWEELGRWARAERDYSAALRAERRGPDAFAAVETEPAFSELEAWLLFRRFSVRAELGRWPGALADLEEAHRRDPKYSWQDRGSLDAALRRRPKDARLLAWRGRARLDRGEWAAASEDLAAARGVPWLSCWRAEALLRLGRREESLALARRARRAAPGYAKARGLLSELELGRGRYGAAAGHARSAIRLYHSAAWAYALLGESLIGQRRFGPARRALDQALDWDRGNGRGYLLRALCRLGGPGVLADLKLARRHGVSADQVAWVRDRARELAA